MRRGYNALQRWGRGVQEGVAGGAGGGGVSHSFGLAVKPGFLRRQRLLSGLTSLLNNKLFITRQPAAAPPPLKDEAAVPGHDLVPNVRCQIKWATQLGVDSGADLHVINCYVINSLNSS